MVKTKNTSKQELENQLEKLTLAIKKQNSFRQTFLRGIIGGVGTALGASIIAGIVIAILAAILEVTGQVPILKDLIRNIEIN